MAATILYNVATVGICSPSTDSPPKKNRSFCARLTFLFDIVVRAMKFICIFAKNNFNQIRTMQNTNKQGESINKESNKLEDKLAYALLFACAIFMMIMVGITYSHHSSPSLINYKICIDTKDSMSINSKYSKLEVLLQDINHKTKLIDEELEQYEKEKENESILQNYGIAILGIVFSIIGFFGFKNFKDIENKSKDIAYNTSKKKLESDLPKQVERMVKIEFDNKMNSEIDSKRIEKIKNEVMKSYEDQINELYMKIEGFEKKDSIPSESKESTDDIKI